VQRKKSLGNVPWTTIAELRAQVQKLWDRGELLAHQIHATESYFPKRLFLKAPSSSDLLNHFEEARAWSRQICDTQHFLIELRDVKHRTLGQNAVPDSAWLVNFEAAIAILNKRNDAVTFSRIVDQTRKREPRIVQWLQRRPLKALEIAEQWPLLLDVVNWMRVHPNPQIYLRQIDLPNVHSKFIESHRAVLSELIEVAAPECVLNPDAQVISRFATRYGFKEKPNRVRFRMLDVKRQFLQGAALQDIELNIESFATLAPVVEKVFITENEINFLAFPSTPNAMVIFGSGYGFLALEQAFWLNQRQIYYWGDIDTHGFAILNQLRHSFAHVKSLLMNRATLMQFKQFWGVEASPTNRDLPMLLTEELDLYNDLRDQRLGINLRLEQEIVGFDWMVTAIRESN
jgi:hypothetical protein